MPRSWGRDHDLSILVETAGGHLSLVVGENRGLVLRLSPAGTLRVVRLLAEALAG